MISDRIKHDNKILELIDIDDKSNLLSDLKFYLPHFMFFL